MEDVMISVIAILVLTGIGIICTVVVAISSYEAHKENPCQGYNPYESPTVVVETKESQPTPIALLGNDNQSQMPGPRYPFKNTDLPFGFLIDNGLIEGTFDCIFPTGDH